MFTNAKNAVDCRILHTKSQNFSGGNTPGLLTSAPGAWTQTPISVWLASVPIVTIYEMTTGGEGRQRKEQGTKSSKGGEGRRVEWRGPGSEGLS